MLLVPLSIVLSLVLLTLIIPIVYSLFLVASAGLLGIIINLTINGYWHNDWSIKDEYQ